MDARGGLIALPALVEANSWPGWHSVKRSKPKQVPTEVLQRPLLEDAAISLLRLVWQRSPELLLGEGAAEVSPHCAYALAPLGSGVA